MMGLIGLFCMTGVGAWVFQPAFASRGAMKRKPAHVEQSFWTRSINGERRAFGTVFDAPEVKLSVVVPAYNEEERLCMMLDPAIEFFEAKCARDRCEACMRGDCECVWNGV